MSFNQTTKHTYILAIAHAQLNNEHVRNATTPAAELVCWDGTEYYVSDDLKSGFAIQADGELVGVFSTVKGRGAQLIACAIHRGATYLDCFEGFLSDMYAKHGFLVVGSTANWNGPDHPRVVYMALAGERVGKLGLTSTGEPWCAAAVRA